MSLFMTLSLTRCHTTAAHPAQWALSDPVVGTGHTTGALPTSAEGIPTAGSCKLPGRTALVAAHLIMLLLSIKALTSFSK